MDKKVFSLALIWTASLSFVYSALVNVDDTSSAFTYTGGTWTKHTNVADSFQLYQSSDTFSSTQGAVATFTYTGGVSEHRPDVFFLYRQSPRISNIGAIKGHSTGIATL